MRSPDSLPRIAVVLAAGKGTRMRSPLPKVLHEAGGRPLLAHVLDAARAANCAPIGVVVGHGAEAVRETFPAADLVFFEQPEQRGTGDALARAAPLLSGPAIALVLSGDVPLVTAATLERLFAAAAHGWGAMAVAELADPGALGRVVSDDGGATLTAIVEAKDASPDLLALRRINAGLYALPAPGILPYLEQLSPDNAQGELYLTDALTAAARDGRRIELVALADPDEALGVNDRAELARVDRLLAEREARARPAGFALRKG